MNKIVWVALLLAGFGIVVWMVQKPMGHMQSMPAWSKIGMENIVKIGIQKTGNEPISMYLKQGKWHVSNGDLAVQDAVLRLLHDATAMQPIRVVTRNHDHDAGLGFLGRAIRLQCWDGQGAMVVDIRVGKQGSDLISTYIRRAGDAAVIAVDKALVWQLSRSQQAWHAEAHKTR